ncbi:hypothetical protein D0C36_00745 [Mucilaginibacter conchicola]|uniref:Uncharacterized protein n=1 Tax=Mucilaginibacter conchicola TaxID=2303333 RepID=A0A372NVF9_9SPHI|nr:hypothetical protein [Mucilaginibacter conchicola]RFZ94118.1 hypothetical protein D0C36_00745 [Mucilaginibacter conchicola]
MKKALLYIIVTVIVAQNTELDQLAKLPILFQHFKEHRQRDSSVTLMQFLGMHYWGDDLNDNDNDRDMQLPFKKMDAHATYVYLLPALRVIENDTQVKPVNNSFSEYRPDYFPDPALSSLFRPPQA